ncbi:Nbl1 / Borealin N terminal [Emericellopsis cladophorae]|uniref:Nbl1 / Borealin N terminal n=1 Tax=Emericellopsis cladophorae TaxID=2686198 RepID=A0A9P9XYZ4_9HYPO|nr:Nbl1 / Borealin N terminal [Emericellopsis cladophorae]KAI6780173.1 Nbl1 / Borealin N terminal [Emericellopsis cladophorae]
MAQGRPPKRASDNAALSPRATTPAQQRSPIKQRKMGISAHHKQALIDNLQLEITERARRLRAQYSLQAQGLRSRIEIRVNRIPMALRKMRMEDLVLKYSEKEQKSTMTARPPPVPAKDRLVRKPADNQSALSKSQVDTRWDAEGPHYVEHKQYCCTSGTSSQDTTRRARSN